VVLGITRIMAELGMRPQIVATGAANPAFAENAAELAPGSKVMMGTDFSQIAAEASTRDIELMVGPFTGRGISRKENIPLLRVGLPNHDRYGASHQLLLGYEGSMNLVEGMANVLLEGGERRSA
jgi:nitrogenase molybdenum-iron protein NifN